MDPLIVVEHDIVRPLFVTRDNSPRPWVPLHVACDFDYDRRILPVTPTSVFESQFQISPSRLTTTFQREPDMAEQFIEALIEFLETFNVAATQSLDGGAIQAYIVLAGQGALPGLQATLAPLYELPIQSPKIIANVGLLNFESKQWVADYSATFEYVTAVYNEAVAGRFQPQMRPDIARKCQVCDNSWPTLIHYIAEPTPPHHLCCFGCMKRKPVGEDIRPLPNGREDTYPAYVHVDGICTAPDCPIKDSPHPAGLYSYPGNPMVLKAATWNLAEKLGEKPELPANDTTVPLTVEFWGGNDRIPSFLRKYALIVAREECLFDRYAEHGGLDRFRAQYPRHYTDKMRHAIISFRTHHAFYQPRETDSLQRDLIFELTRPNPGSKEWCISFVSGLSKVALESLADDDRSCPVCLGAYEQETSLNDTVEHAVKLRCGHHFGSECLPTLLSDRFNLCLICNAEVYKAPDDQNDDQRVEWFDRFWNTRHLLVQEKWVPSLLPRRSRHLSKGSDPEEGSSSQDQNFANTRKTTVARLFHAMTDFIIYRNFRSRFFLSRSSLAFCASI